MKSRIKSRIFMASSFFALAVLCQPLTHAQLPNPTPRRPTPVTGTSRPTGTVTGGTQNVINSKLLVYTRNGLGTTNTSTNGEFASQLVALATVNGEFSLQWSRPTPGKAEKGMVYIRRTGIPGAAEGLISNLAPTIPAQSTVVNIGIAMPSSAAGTYEMRVVGESGSSSRVIVNYTGKGSKGQAAVITPAPTGGLPAATKTPLYVTGGKFTPMVGAPKEPNYTKAKLTLNLRTLAATTVSKIEVEVWSEPWTNSELITNSKSKNSPIMIFKGKWEALGGSNQIHKDKDNRITVALSRTSKNDVQAQETGPGFYSPGDWGRAFAQTTTASFRWTVDGKLSGSFDQSPKQQWQSGAP